jgi:hypothetical protein
MSSEDDEHFREDLFLALAGISAKLDRIVHLLEVLPHNIAHKQGYQPFLAKDCLAETDTLDD